MSFGFFLSFEKKGVRERDHSEKRPIGYSDLGKKQIPLIIEKENNYIGKEK